MANRHPVPIAKFIDDYDEERVIHRRPNGTLRVKQRQITPIVALSSAVGRFSGQRIRAARIAAGLTMEQLASKASVRGGKQRIREIERGENGGLRTGTLYAIAHALGMEPIPFLPTTEQAMADAGVILSTEERPVVAGSIELIA